MDDFYAARSGSIPPLPWSNFAPPFSVSRPHAARLSLWPWIEAAGRRLHRNMLVIALANKLARIAWAVLARGHAYQPRSASHAM